MRRTEVTKFSHLLFLYPKNSTERLFQMTYLILAENEIITAEGRQVSFDQMVDRIDCHETILRYKDGSFACSRIQDITAELECEDMAVTKLKLSTGEEILLLDSSELLTTDNQWVRAETVEVGHAMKALTYNPSVKHPQLTPKIITSVERYVAPFLPMVSFQTLSDNLLLNVTKGKNISVLIPIRPVSQLASLEMVC